MLVAWGYSNEQIAEELGVTTMTVNGYFSRIKGKLRVPDSLCLYRNKIAVQASRLWMVLYALKAGALELSDVELPEEEKGA